MKIFQPFPDCLTFRHHFFSICCQFIRKLHLDVFLVFGLRILIFRIHLLDKFNFHNIKCVAFMLIDGLLYVIILIKLCRIKLLFLFRCPRLFSTSYSISLLCSKGIFFCSRFLFFLYICIISFSIFATFSFEITLFLNKLSCNLVLSYLYLSSIAFLLL